MQPNDQQEPLGDPLGDPGKLSELAWLPVDKLMVDERYQRDTGSKRSKSIITKITKNFVWRRFGAIAVVPNDDTWFVVDGQHRVEAARARGDIAHVPAVVMKGITAAEAAADFVAINKDRVRMTPQQEYKAMLQAGDPVAVAVQQIADDTGLIILRSTLQVSKQKPGQTLAVGTMLSIYKTWGADALAAACRIILTAFPKTPGAASANLLKALSYVIFESQRDEATLTSELSKRAVEDLIAAGQARYRPGYGTYIALAAELRGDPIYKPKPVAGPVDETPTAPGLLPDPAPRKLAETHYTAEDLQSARRALGIMGFDVDVIGDERYQIGEVTFDGIGVVDFHRRMAAQGVRHPAPVQNTAGGRG